MPFFFGLRSHYQPLKEPSCGDNRQRYDKIRNHDRFDMEADNAKRCIWMHVRLDVLESHAARLCNGGHTPIWNMLLARTVSLSGFSLGCGGLVLQRSPPSCLMLAKVSRTRKNAIVVDPLHRDGIGLGIFGPSKRGFPERTNVPLKLHFSQRPPLLHAVAAPASGIHFLKSLP